MSSRRIARLALFAVLALVVGFALVDVLGLRTGERSVRGEQGYVEIPHGNHFHYVPNDWDGSVSISDFPTSPPPEGMTVGPTGQIIPIE
ncbi:MAG: hypothetical protein AAF845_10330 [Bacteroidota bacterium]